VEVRVGWIGGGLPRRQGGEGCGYRTKEGGGRGTGRSVRAGNR